MPDFPTYADLFRIAEDEVLSRNSALTRDVVERDGTDANALTAAGASVGDECIGQLAAVNASVFLSSARGTALDKLAYDRYQLLRKQAAPALGVVNFSCTTATTVGFSIPQGTTLATADGRQFTTLSNATFPVASTGPVSVQVQSTLAGLAQQSRANTITSIISTLPNAPSTLSVTNPLATQGAADEEDDDSYRNRAQNYYSTAHRGTIAAIEQATLTVSGVQSAFAYEAVDATGAAARLVSVVVADQFTEQLIDTTSIPAVYQTQANALVSNIQQALYDVRAGGIQVSIVVAQVVLQGITLTLSFTAGVDQTAVAQQAVATAVSYVNSLQPGQPLLYKNLVAAIETVPGLVPTGSEVVSPAGDVYPKTLQVLRTSTGLVLVSATGALTV